MRKPSIKTLMSISNVTMTMAHDIRIAMEELPLRSAMAKIDQILNTYGVEHIEKGLNVKSPAITYCNSGDTYNTTILYIHKRGPWGQDQGFYTVSCWGNYVENGRYN